jgi:catechol 2,3-dioxygenase-like lactoylglutathione lyase family enzyme
MAGRREPELINFRPNLLVRDVTASVEFYRDVLGFEVRNAMEDGSFCLLGKGLAEVAVVLTESPPVEQAYLYVRGVEALHERCQLAEVDIARPLTDHPWGLRDFVVRDPDGHLIGIGERV